MGIFDTVSFGRADRYILHPHRFHWYLFAVFWDTPTARPFPSCLINEIIRTAMILLHSDSSEWTIITIVNKINGRCGWSDEDYALQMVNDGVKNTVARWLFANGQHLDVVRTLRMVCIRNNNEYLWPFESWMKWRYEHWTIRHLYFIMWVTYSMIENRAQIHVFIINHTKMTSRQEKSWCNLNNFKLGNK